MIRLNEDEKVILRIMNKDFKYMARDKNGDLWVYGVKPVKKEKDGQWWDPDNGLLPFSGLFQFIKWEDEEPYLIEDLLKEDEYDDEENGVPFDDEE